MFAIPKSSPFLWVVQIIPSHGSCVVGFPSQSTDTSRSQEAEDEAAWPHFTRVDRTKTRGSPTRDEIITSINICMYIYTYILIL